MTTLKISMKRRSVQPLRSPQSPLWGACQSKGRNAVSWDREAVLARNECHLRGLDGRSSRSPARRCIKLPAYSTLRVKLLLRASPQVISPLLCTQEYTSLIVHNFMIPYHAGAVGRLRTEDKRLSRRTQSFLPRRLQPGQKRPSKFAERSPARERQLSAMNRTVRTLQNKLSERSKRLEEVSRENRLLNRLQKRQDREWTKIQRQEDELPQTLQRHEQEVLSLYSLLIPRRGCLIFLLEKTLTIECYTFSVYLRFIHACKCIYSVCNIPFCKVRALRKQLRKSHEVAMASQQRVGEMQDEVRRLSDVNHKLETLVGKKRLLERDQLTVQLEQLTQQLTDKENRITVRQLDLYT